TGTPSPTLVPCTTLFRSGPSSSLEAQLDNHRTIQADQPLSINKSAVQHRSSGKILAGAELDLSLSDNASFTNTGTLDVESGKTLSVDHGTYLKEGSVTGA